MVYIIASVDTVSYIWFLYDSISSVIDSNIPYFFLCIQLIFGYHVLVLVLLLVQWGISWFNWESMVAYYVGFVHSVWFWMFWIECIYFLLDLICFNFDYGEYFKCTFVICWVLDTADPLKMIGISRVIFIYAWVNIWCYSFGKCDVRINCFYPSFYWFWGKY